MTIASSTTKSSRRINDDLRKLSESEWFSSQEQNIKADHLNRDTFDESNNFFSYRRSTIMSQKDYGRCISTIKMI